MRFLGRNQAAPGQPAEAPETERPVFDVIANIEHAVDNFKEVEMPRWKYRQIIREGKRSADEALSEAQGGPTARFGFMEE
jgi:hypothetical protein